MKSGWLWLAVLAGLVLTLLFVVGCSQNEPAAAPDHSGHSGSNSDAGNAAAVPAADAAVPATPATTQTTCPVMAGNPISKDIYVDYEGRRIYFCCAACPDMFRQDPEKYLAILDGRQPATAPAAGTHRH